MFRWWWLGTCQMFTSTICTVYFVILNCQLMSVLFLLMQIYVIVSCYVKQVLKWRSHTAVRWGENIASVTSRDARRRHNRERTTLTDLLHNCNLTNWLKTLEFANSCKDYSLMYSHSCLISKRYSFVFLLNVVIHKVSAAVRIRTDSRMHGCEIFQRTIPHQAAVSTP